MDLAETSATASSVPSPHEPRPAVVDYARALRAIGQDLTDLFPKVLEIETDGVNFEARGESHPNPFQQLRESAFKKLWNKLFGKDAKAQPIAPAPSALIFARAYTLNDIEELDRLYAANRTGQRKRPDAYSLAERLRIMGAIVNSRNGRLKQLRKNADRLFVDYWDQDGKIQTAKLTTVILYRNQQRNDFPGRAPTPKELWEGYDF